MNFIITVNGKIKDKNRLHFQLKSKCFIILQICPYTVICKL